MTTPARRLAAASIFGGLWICMTVSAQPIQLTNIFEIGGGGCVGETRIYEESVVAAERKARESAGSGNAGGTALWKEIDRGLQTRTRYFLTTVGCGGDQVAISLGGRAYLLDAFRVEELGRPVTYLSDNLPSPRVRIEKVSASYTGEFGNSRCTKRFEKVRVHIEFNNSIKVVLGTAISSCP